MSDEPSRIPEDADHFTVFGLPRKLELDRKALDREFLRLSREYHPDRFAGAPAGALLVAQRNSAKVNDAYRALSDDVMRAEHLLELQGIERPEGRAKCPPDLLEEVFELRERMMEGEADAAAEKARGLLREAEQALSALFREHDEADDPREVLGRVRAALDRRKFLSGLLREAES